MASFIYLLAIQINNGYKRKNFDKFKNWTQFWLHNSLMNISVEFSQRYQKYSLNKNLFKSQCLGIHNQKYILN